MATNDMVAATSADDDLDAEPYRRGQFLRSVLRDRATFVGAVVLGLIVAVALLAPVLAPHDPNHQNFTSTLRGPSSEFWLGTDTLGRDVLSRLIYGTRVSLFAGFEATAIAFGIGLPLGLLAGYRRGWVERALNLLMDSLLSVPALVLALAVIATLGPGLTVAMSAIGMVIAPRFYRLAQVSTREINEEPFIRCARSIGCTNTRILIRHILPNIIPPIIIQISFVLGASVLAEASLSFLGLGATPPTASWGSMLTDAAQRLDRPHLIWGPGIALTLTVLACSTVGDGLRAALRVGRGGKG